VKISDKTIGILKNFSTINSSILIKPGQTLATVSPQKSIMAKAAIEENMPSEFAIYDLSRFLGVVSLLKDPDYKFEDKYVEISTSNQTVRYTYTDPEQIIAPPAKEINFPDPDVEFELTGEDLSSVIRAGSVLQMPEIAVVGRDGKVYVSAVDSKNVSTDTYSIEVGSTAHNFTMIFKTENLKFINASYNVAITSKGLARFKSDVVTYWVATETTSSFGD